MSDAIPIPPRPSLEQYKKLAKDLQHVCKSGDDAAFATLITSWLEKITQLQGRDLTPDLRADIAREVRRMVPRWQKARGNGSLTSMQLLLARGHGFKSWPRFADHIRALESGSSDVEAFEAAADAIVDGDIAKLGGLLKAHPKLARQRSTREHRSTLLHYVSANGIEDFRQRTPQNIVAITNLLIDSGADVNAISDAYGGNSDVLGLVATSYHPDAAGVQIELMQALIDRGHRVDYSDILGVLHNGRGRAAEFLASRASTLDLPSAAAVGRLDIVKGWFEPDGRLKPGVSDKQAAQALLFASQFGRTEAVRFLLEQGIPASALAKPKGETGLHWAGFNGHAEIAALLLDQGAPIDLVEDQHGGTSLGWTLYGWKNSGRKNADENYARIVALLVRDGATIDPGWFSDESGRSNALDAAITDPRMAAALRGESLQ
jgi:ankyrin repeat protein